MDTYFDIAVNYFTNEQEDVYFEFSHTYDRGVHTITVTFDGLNAFYTFDDDTVDRLNEYLHKVYSLNEDLYDDVTDFLFDSFFECLEETITEESGSVRWD